MKKIIFFIACILLFVFAPTFVFAQEVGDTLNLFRLSEDTTKEESAKALKSWLTPNGYRQLKVQSDLGEGTYHIEISERAQRGVGVNRDCPWLRYEINFVPVKPKIIAGESYFFTRLPTVWKFFPDTALLKLIQPKKEEPKKVGPYFFVNQRFTHNFANRSQINKTNWWVTKIGIERNPMGNLWSWQAYFGFQPRTNFDKSFNLPNVSANPGPNEGWCDCEAKERHSQWLIGGLLSRRVPLGHVIGGEWGLRASLSADKRLSKKPIREEKNYSIPGAVGLGIFGYAQIPLKDVTKQKTQSILGLWGGLLGQLTKGAHPGLAIQAGANLSFETKLWTKKPKDEAKDFVNPRLLGK